MKKLNVAILGFGTVGGGTYEILKNNADIITVRSGAEIRVTKIFSRSLKKGLPKDIYTDNIDEVLSDNSIDCVVEVLGGVQPATEYMIKAMDSGKHVISANKAAIAESWKELNEAAERNNVKFLYEASVGGGIPVLTAIRGQLSGNRFTEVTGIVNGTSNYILTKMSEEGLGYTDALRQAQELGFAESDPTADVEGFDAANKLTILTALLFDEYIHPMDIPRCGMVHITEDDIRRASEKHEKIKLIARAYYKNGELRCSVKPEGVAYSHPLSSVSNEYNAIYITGDAVGDIMLYGKGAGALPTGSAVVGDIISLVK